MTIEQILKMLGFLLGIAWLAYLHDWQTAAAIWLTVWAVTWRAK